MSFLNKLIIPEKNIKEEDWEDPSMSGWMTCITILLLLFTIFGLAEAFNRPFVPTWLKWAEVLLYILPVYSCIGLMLRFRDAIFCSLVSLSLIAALSGSTLFRLVVFQVDFTDSLLTIIYFVSALSSILYFLFSKQAKSRFPYIERRVFWFDIIPVVLSSVITLIVVISSINVTINSSNWKADHLRVLDVTLQKSFKMGDYDNEFFLTNVEPVNDKLIFFFVINRQGTLFETSPDVINEIDNNEYLRLNIKKEFIENNPLLMEHIKDLNLDMVLNFFIENYGDGSELFIRKEEIEETEQLKEAAKRLEETYFRKISNFADSINSLCPIEINPQLSLTEVVSNEVKLNYKFTLNDRKTSFVEYESEFEDFASSLCPRDKKYDESKLPSFAAPESILNLMKNLEMDLVYTLTASNSRFSKDYTEWRLYVFTSPSLRTDSDSDTDEPNDSETPETKYPEDKTGKDRKERKKQTYFATFLIHNCYN